MHSESITIEEENTLYARPNQSLYTHIANMLNQFRSLKLPKLNFFNIGNKEKEQEIYNNFAEILLIAHDFGKINPFFQEKIILYRNKKASKLVFFENTKLTYHSQIGALFAWIVLINYTDKETIIYPNIERDLLLHNLAITYAIFNHHNTRFLPNTIIYNISKFGMDFQYKDLATIISKINQKYPSSSEKQLRLFIDEKNKKEELNLNIQYSDPLKRFFAKCCLKNEEIIEHLDDAIDMLRDLEDEEEVGEIVDEIQYYWRLYKNDNRLFFLILYYYSVLCDLDEWDAKAHVNDSSEHNIPFENKEINIEEKIVESYKKAQFASDKETKEGELLNLKKMLWEDVNQFLATYRNEKLIQICYPTGSGKTLSYFHLAFSLRNKIQKEKGYTPRIIYALPFISLTDQVGEEMKKVLKEQFNQHTQVLDKQSDLLVIHHHLVETEWTYFGEEEKEEINFARAKDFIKLWDSNIILTTFVSFWNSLLGGQKRNHLRFHKLAGAIIILDEIQGIPIKYWQLISTLIHQMCSFLNCTIIVGSATFPEAISHKYEWNRFPTTMLKIRNKEEKTRIDRYTLIIEKNRVPLDSFAQKTLDFIKANKDKSIMFVLNTKESARLLFNYLKQEISNREILFLSSAVRYNDRVKILEKIKSNERKVLICTQVIEAGIDVSFDIVFRDLAPLDSIIQVAGRCNRYNKEKGKVYVIELTDPESINLTYYAQIYDPILTEQTKKLLYNNENIGEKELRVIVDKFYNELTIEGEKKDTKSCVNEFLETRLENLTKKFQLIKEKEEETLVICEKEKELMNLTISIDSEKVSSSLRKYRGNMITISKRLREKLEKKMKKDLKTIYFGTKLKIWGLYLEKNEWVYQENGGL
ncbi:MAG: CRISPR-associated helicase Cas3', partial [Candidatus Heimdallarchaeaceae archaeon]